MPEIIIKTSLAGVLQLKLWVILVLPKQDQQFVALEHFQPFQQLFPPHSSALHCSELLQQTFEGGSLSVLSLVGQQELPQFMGQLFNSLLQSCTSAGSDDVQIDDASFRVSSCGEGGLFHQGHCFFHVLLIHLVGETHPGEGLTESDQGFQLSWGGSYCLSALSFAPQTFVLLHQLVASLFRKERVYLLPRVGNIPGEFRQGKGTLAEWCKSYWGARTWPWT